MTAATSTSTAYEARFWDRIARKYARDPIKDLVGYERTLARTRELLASPDTVLEIGCGTGTTALKLAPSVQRIVGTDISGEMITIARERTAAAALGNAEFMTAPAQHIGGADRSYDAVLAFNLLHLVADRPTTLREVLRVVKPGGLFISKTPCLAEMNPLIRLAVPAMRAIGKAPHVSFFSGPQLEAEIAGMGFAIIERARHGSGRKDARVFIVARKPL
jgi:ubiquinone/menaquinone biosynthesis C-methylase UbiE